MKVTGKFTKIRSFKKQRNNLRQSDQKITIQTVTLISTFYKFRTAPQSLHQQRFRRERLPGSGATAFHLSS